MNLFAVPRGQGYDRAVGRWRHLVARIDGDRRLDLLAEARGVLEDSPARLELARALVYHGEALRVARRRKAAHEPLRRGTELAANCGARGLRTRAHERSAALGDQPRSRMFSGQ